MKGLYNHVVGVLGTLAKEVIKAPVLMTVRVATSLKHNYKAVKKANVIMKDEQLLAKRRADANAIMKAHAKEIKVRNSQGVSDMYSSYR